MTTCFQEWFEPKNLSDYPYFAVESAPLKLNIGFQVRTCFQEWHPLKWNIGFQVRTCFHEWSEPKNLSDYLYFAVENAPLKLNIGFQVRTCFQEWKNAPFKIEHRVSSENLLPGVV